MSRYTSISPDPHQPEKQMHTYEYPRPAVTVDCVVFGYDLDTEELSVLAIKRGEDPRRISKIRRIAGRLLSTPAGRKGAV